MAHPVVTSDKARKTSDTDEGRSSEKSAPEAEKISTQLQIDSIA
jgi:hypothetical protein